MRYSLATLISILLFNACRNKNGISGQSTFIIRQIQLKSDTTISAIAYFENMVICLQNNNKLLILDTAYNREHTLENKLNGYKPNYLFTLHDTVFITTKSKTYFIGSKFRITEYKLNNRLYANGLYKDSLYYVYGCCVGEFGGAVFFLNKKTNRTYSYFATCATQVLKFKGRYVVCNNLAHLERSMSYLFVREPTKLYELTDEKLKHFCNWYAKVDSLKYYWGHSAVGDTKFYRGSPRSMSLITFQANDSLYSLVCNDSTTYIAVHKNDTTLCRQMVFDKTIEFHQAQVVSVGHKQICLYNLTGGSPFAAYLTRGHSSGLVVIDGNRIDILDRSFPAKTFY